MPGFQHAVEQNGVGGIGGHAFPEAVLDTNVTTGAISIELMQNACQREQRQR